MTAHELISLLEAAHIHFSMSNIRENAVMFHIAVPGERWEAEVFSDGRIEFERFVASGEIANATDLLTLISQFKD